MEDDYLRADLQLVPGHNKRKCFTSCFTTYKFNLQITGDALYIAIIVGLSYTIIP